jgi:hypothetical protein
MMCLTVLICHLARVSACHPLAHEDPVLHELSSRSFEQLHINIQLCKGSIVVCMSVCSYHLETSCDNLNLSEEMAPSD